ASLNDLTPGGIGGLDYAIMGEWLLKDASDANVTHAGVFLAGYQTPAANMPTSGTATYSLNGAAAGELFVPAKPGSFGQTSQLNLTGDVSLTADFTAGGGTISGSLTNMVASAPGSTTTTPWNSVTLTGSISGDAFSGTTAATSAPTNADALASSATGSLNGGFYGPRADEVGAVWTLADGAKSAVGVFGAPSPFVVSAFSSPATLGASPAGLQQAFQVGPSFTAASGDEPAAGTVFPLLQSALAVTQSGIAPDTATDTAGGTATVVSLGGPGNTFELKLPSLGVDANVTTGAASDVAAGGGYLSIADLTPGGFGALGYATMDEWVLKDAADANVTNAGLFIAGYQTPQVNMPGSGTAQYSQTGGVTGELFIPGGPGPYGRASQLTLTGDVTLNAAFASGSISGSLTNMQATAAGSATPWNNVTISASITGAAFSGTTSTPSTLPNPDALGPGATGSISGAFFGPTADEVAAVWTLSNTGGGKSAVGVLGAGAPVTSYSLSQVAAASLVATTPVQTAVGGGPTFTNAIPLGSATPFPVFQSTVLITPRATIPDSQTNSEGATVTMGPGGGGNAVAASVSIPSLGINNVPVSSGAPDPNFNSTAVLYSGNLGGTNTLLLDLQSLDYVSMDVWAVSPTGQPVSATNRSAGVFGYATPLSGMPTSGTATFSGSTVGLVTVPQGATYATAALSGAASMTVDFGAGSFTGALTGMTATPLASGGASETWNHVAFTGSPGSISGASFSGTTSVSFAPTPAGVYTLGSGATGVVNGAFYGPNAQNVGGVWSLFGGVKGAFGSFVARTAPSDRRLKRDIEPLGRTTSGLSLYRFRYLGGVRAFVGVMAQDLESDPRYAGAVIERPDGLKIVDYGRLGLDVADLDAMRAAGAAAIAAYHRLAA
ncbi:MAG: transferrin-binding protein-like solute binding protein, partial [Caulobacteraceae bacterium]|nr:transferrin-binding protein-like solute binding protein [Caulobacteraceae bacterium]